MTRKRSTPKKSAAAERLSQADVLVQLALPQATLFRAPDDEPMAAVTVWDANHHFTHREHHRLSGKDFKNWLTAQYYQATNRALSPQALVNALGLLEAKARHEGPGQPVFVRVGRDAEAVYLDLGDPRWTCIQIRAGSWERLSRHPIAFIRPPGLLPLPNPADAPAEALDDLLLPFLNVADHDWQLVLAWLTFALAGDGAFPVLGIHGPHGSAKSTTSRRLRATIDPNLADLRGLPRNEEDLAIAASNAWLLTYDNLSHLTPWMSDAFCRLATGTALSTRRLYTNREEVLFHFRRPLLINGIEDLASRADLMDRTLHLELPAIPAIRRQPDKQLEQEFQHAHAAILGALLSAAARALEQLPHAPQEPLERMADFHRWGTALERGLAWPSGSFARAYRANRAKARRLVLESDVLYQPLVDFLARQGGDWLGTHGELLPALTLLAGERARTQDWPKTPRGLQSHLRRLDPVLAEEGIHIETGEHLRSSDSSRERRFRIYTQEPGARPSTLSDRPAPGRAADGSDSPDE